jgi:hypothetical protein
MFTFRIQVPNIHAAVLQAQQAITQHGGVFQGDDNSGTFSVPVFLFTHITGSYTTADPIITVTIDNSIPGVSPNDVAQRAAAFFGGQVVP